MRAIAENTVRRLSLYLRFLEEFQHEGASTVSSEALAARGGTTSAQVRKDLSLFGSFGKRGLGYSVPQLLRRLREILGLDQRYQVIVIGAGKLGSALAQHRGFEQRGFDIVAIYDNHPGKIGKCWNGMVVRDVATLTPGPDQPRADVAIIVTPAEGAQAAADRAVACGVTAILNFAPMSLHVPASVSVRNVNLVLEMEALSFALAERRR